MNAILRKEFKNEDDVIYYINNYKSMQDDKKDKLIIDSVLNELGDSIFYFLKSFGDDYILFRKLFDIITTEIVISEFKKEIEYFAKSSIVEMTDTYDDNDRFYTYVDLSEYRFTNKEDMNDLICDGIYRHGYSFSKFKLIKFFQK